MASLREDKEYQTLKQEVQRKEISSGVLEGVAAIATVGAIGFATGGLGIVAITASPALAVGAGIIAAATGFVGWKQSVDVSFDREELNARRNAVDLSHALGDEPSRDKAVAYSMGMNAGRADGRSWVEEETQRRATSQGQQR